MRALSLLLALGAFSPGAILFQGAPALGSDLAGGSITVTFTGGGTASATITNPSGSLGQATNAGNFAFQVCCETSGNDWTLTNNSNLDIISFVIALAGSRSAFDNGATPYADFSGTHPSAPNGLTNAPGGVDTIFSGVSFTDQITDVQPVGAQNMYRTLTLTPATPLAPGATALFAADTDVEAVPEPSTVIPVLVGLAAIAHRRRARA